MITFSLLHKLLRRIKNLFLNLNFYLFILPKYNKSNVDYIFVTGSDSTHFKSVINCIISIQKQGCKVIFWDLGCTPAERSEIERLNVTVKTFPYNNFPSFFNIKINAGNYAWKPAIIYMTISEYKVPVFWFDAGNILFCRKKIVATTLIHGFYSPYSVKRIRDLTFPSLIDKFRNIGNIENKRNLNGACVCFNPNNTKSMQLLREWFDFAQEIDYIAPEGSSRLNHRQDQSLLTLLAYKHNLVNRMPHGYLDFSIHNDVD